MSFFKSVFLRVQLYLKQFPESHLFFICVHILINAFYWFNQKSRNIKSNFSIITSDLKILSFQVESHWRFSNFWMTLKTIDYFLYYFIAHHVSSQWSFNKISWTFANFTKIHNTHLQTSHFVQKSCIIIQMLLPVIY